MQHILRTAIIAAALIGPVAIVPASLRAEDRKYHDRAHNDDHQWNDHEDKAYRMWATENHRKYRSFDRIKENDRQTYWGWRHEHSDSLLKIEVR
jgi:hypothetical protein